MAAGRWASRASLPGPTSWRILAHCVLTLCLAATHATSSPGNNTLDSLRLPALKHMDFQHFQSLAKLWADRAGAARLDDSALALATPPSPQRPQLNCKQQGSRHLMRSTSPKLRDPTQKTYPERQVGHLAKSLQTSSIPSLRYLSPGAQLRHSTITLQALPLPFLFLQSLGKEAG